MSSACTSTRSRRSLDSIEKRLALLARSMASADTGGMKLPPFLRRRMSVLITAVIVSLSSTIGAVEFNRDVRPILADHCYQCHGPDARQRKGDLRLDTDE